MCGVNVIQVHLQMIFQPACSSRLPAVRIRAACPCHETMCGTRRRLLKILFCSFVVGSVRTRLRGRDPQNRKRQK